SLLHLDDEAAEINVTPDRGYVLSMRGVAREYSHATGTVFSDPAEAIEPPAANSEGWPVRIEDTAPIHGNSGATGFLVRPLYAFIPQVKAPFWLCARLCLAAILPVCLVVNSINYVMLEPGQPSHGYDSEKSPWDIVIRRAYTDETL